MALAAGQLHIGNDFMFRQIPTPFVVLSYEFRNANPCQRSTSLLNIINIHVNQQSWTFDVTASEFDKKIFTPKHNCLVT